MNLNLNQSVLSLLAVFAATLTQAAELSVTQRILKPIIQYQCEQELDQSKAWKVATYLMSDQKKLELKNEQCNCVSDHALKNIPAKELLKATVNEEAKSAITKQAVLNSIQYCVIRSK